MITPIEKGATARDKPFEADGLFITIYDRSNAYVSAELIRALDLGGSDGIIFTPDGADIWVSASPVSGIRWTADGPGAKVPAARIIRHTGQNVRLVHTGETRVVGQMTFFRLTPASND